MWRGVATHSEGCIQQNEWPCNPTLSNPSIRGAVSAPTAASMHSTSARFTNSWWKYRALIARRHLHALGPSRLCSPRHRNALCTLVF
jgi:hypothetical protein